MFHNTNLNIQSMWSYLKKSVFLNTPKSGTPTVNAPMNNNLRTPCPSSTVYKLLMKTTLLSELINFSSYPCGWTWINSWVNQILNLCFQIIKGKGMNFNMNSTLLMNNHHQYWEHIAYFFTSVESDLTFFLYLYQELILSTLLQELIIYGKCSLIACFH